MKSLAPIAAALLGLGLAAFAAPQVSCGCAPPRPETLGQATVVALEVLCVTAPGRDVSVEHGFEYWGDFSEFETDEGALEVRPGPSCTLTYLGAQAGAQEVIQAIDLWADARHMEHPAGLQLDGGVRYGNGLVEWRIVQSPATATQTVKIDYWPASI